MLTLCAENKETPRKDTKRGCRAARETLYKNIEIMNVTQQTSSQANEGLIAKYNVPAPRYTSYPPANYFADFTPEQYLEAVARTDRDENNISWYIHMPFCRKLCHYCGCNSYPMQKPEAVERYVNAIHHEIDLMAPHLRPNRKISQIHYGGGSPTAVAPRFLKEINDHLLSLHATIDRPEIAIECHPGYLQAKDWNELLDCGFNRFSIGVQDLDEHVLKVVNREPSLMPLRDIFGLLRNAGATINLDFLYGLPLQTPESFARNIEAAAELRPDRLVTFSYGHVPWVHKRQLALEKIGLPEERAKQRMGANARAIMLQAGYRSIGMDHYVLPEDELSKALDNHYLRRNFQGYCTLRTTGQVYALGVTGISQLSTAYAQNSHDIDGYMANIEAGRLDVRRGYALTHRDQMVREVVESLMCNYHADWKDIAKRMGVSREELREALHWDENQLREMESDGLFTRTEDTLTMTTEGTPFVRNVVAALDPLMVNTTRKFSKPI